MSLSLHTCQQTQMITTTNFTISVVTKTSQQKHMSYYLLTLIYGDVLTSNKVLLANYTGTQFIACASVSGPAWGRPSLVISRTKKVHDEMASKHK